MSITKQGIVSTSCISETFVSLLDTNFYVEPDGSVWIRIFHHNNPATVRFSSSNDFTKPIYIDDDRWCNMTLVNLITNDTYEFMVKSKLTSDATENKYRWIQTKNPYTAVFADVAAANVTKITTSGYSSYSWGGLYKFNSSTYFCTNNGTNGNWWGAVGAWNAHQGGIPGWISVITTGYEDVYLRIDNQINNGVSIFKNSIISNNFIEI